MIQERILLADIVDYVPPLQGGLAQRNSSTFLTSYISICACIPFKTFHEGTQDINGNVSLSCRCDVLCVKVTNILQEQ